MEPKKKKLFYQTKRKSESPIGQTRQSLECQKSAPRGGIYLIN